MPAPDPSLIVEDPAPLNPTDFPLAVQEFPAQSLRDTVGLFRSRGNLPPQTEENPLQYER